MAQQHCEIRAVLQLSLHQVVKVCNIAATYPRCVSRERRFRARAKSPENNYTVRSVQMSASPTSEAHAQNARAYIAPHPSLLLVHPVFSLSPVVALSANDEGYRANFSDGGLHTCRVCTRVYVIVKSNASRGLVKARPHRDSSIECTCDCIRDVLTPGF